MACGKTYGDSVGLLHVHSEAELKANKHEADKEKQAHLRRDAREVRCFALIQRSMRPESVSDTVRAVQGRDTLWQILP